MEYRLVQQVFNLRLGFVQLNSKFRRRFQQTQAASACSAQQRWCVHAPGRQNRGGL